MLIVSDLVNLLVMNCKQNINTSFTCSREPEDFEALLIAMADMKNTS